jgi:hypothetical protein
MRRSAVPFAMAAMLVTDARFSVLLLIPVTLLLTMSLGILPSAQQAIVHSRMRGLTASLGVLMVNMIGLGLGPTIIALGIDYGFHDPLMLRYSLTAALQPPVKLGIRNPASTLGEPAPR